MALNVFRQSPGRLVSSDLIPKSISDAGYLVAQAYFEGLNNYTLSIGQASFALNGQTLSLLASRYLSMAVGGGGGGSPFTFIDSTFYDGDINGGTTNAIDTTGATILIASVHYYAFGGTPTLTDSKGNTWTALTAYQDALPDSVVRLYYCISPTVGAGHDFTIAGSGTYSGVRVLAFSSTSTPIYDTQNGNNANALTIQTGIINPSNSNNLFIAAATFYANPTPMSIDSSFTIDSYTGNSGNSYGAVIAYKINTSSSSENPTFTGTGSSFFSAAAIANFYVTGGGGGGSPTYVLNGQAITFIKGFQMPISNGSFNLTGNNLTLIAARKLALALGNYLLNGQSVALKKGVSITLAAGTFTLTGYNTQLLRNLTIAMGQGSFNINGQLLAFLRTLKLTAAQGSFILNGQAVALKKSVILALSQGAFTLTGYSINIATTGSMAMGQGSFALNGQALLLKRAKVLAMAKGQFNLTGQSTTIVAQRKITIANGNYIINGQPLLLKIGHNLSLTKGQFNLTGYNLNLAIGRLLTAAKADFNITGNALNFKRDLIITLTQGSYIVNGQDVNLVFIDVQYGGTLYQCVSGVLELADLPDFYNNRTITGKRLWYIKDGVKRLIHTASH